MKLRVIGATRGGNVMRGGEGKGRGGCTRQISHALTSAWRPPSVGDAFESPGRENE